MISYSVRFQTRCSDWQARCESAAPGSRRRPGPARVSRPAPSHGDSASLADSAPGRTGPGPNAVPGVQSHGRAAVTCV